MNARMCSAALLLAGIAACSGNANISPAIPTQPPGAARKVLARLVITVPPREHAHGRRVKYVSPATASLAYSIDGVQQPAVSIGPASSNCRVSGAIGYLTCTVTMAPTPGRHTFSFTTLDANAKVLSANTQVVATIVTGQANSILVTLGGVAASFAVYPPNVPQVTQIEGGGFNVYGKTALQFSIVPLDADRNAILGPGAPQPVVSAAPAGMVMNTPSPKAPNLWTFTSTYAPTDPSVAKVSSIVVSATPVPNSGGTTLSAAVPLSLYVPWVYATSEAIGDTIAITDELGNPQSVLGPFTNLASVSGIAYDSHNNRLYIENGRTDNITVYDVQGDQQPVSGSFQDSGPDSPSGIAFDPHNNLLYVSYYQASKIAVFNEQGQEQPTSGSFPNLAAPGGIAYDAADQELFVANVFGSVTAYDEQGNQITLSGTFANIGAPAGVAYDPINTFLYVADSFGGVTVYDTQGNQQTVSGSFPGIGQSPTSIAYDPHTDWFYVGDCSSAQATPIRVYSPNGDAEATSGTFAVRVPGITIVP